MHERFVYYNGQTYLIRRFDYSSASPWPHGKRYIMATGIIQGMLSTAHSSRAIVRLYHR